MKISFDGQLITTSLIVTFRGKTLQIDDNGLLGLDILMTYNFVVDMDKLELYPSQSKAEDSV